MVPSGSKVVLPSGEWQLQEGVGSSWALWEMWTLWFRCRCLPLVAQCWHPALALWCTCSCFAALLSLDISLLGCATMQYVESGIRLLQQAVKKTLGASLGDFFFYYLFFNIRTLTGNKSCSYLAGRPPKSAVWSLHQNNSEYLEREIIAWEQH